MARPHPTLMALARSETTEPPTDVEELLRSATEHRMTGVLWSAVIDDALDLPVSAIRALAAEDLAAAAHHHRLWNVLEEVTGRLHATGIGSVTFKGVTDEARWFSRLGERPCADVDIVIDDIDRYDDAIAALDPGHQLVGHATRVARAGYLHAVDLLVDDVLIDLHVDPIKVGTGWRHPRTWFESTLEVSTPTGGAVKVFGPEAVAVLKLLHVGRDRFRDLLGLVEADRVFRSGVSWPRVRELARMEGIEAPVGVAAEIVASELGRTGPQPGVLGARAALWRSWWKPEVRLLGQLGRVRHIRRSQWGLPLTMPGRTVESLLWLARSVMPPAPILDLKHPDARGPYPWRVTAGRAHYLIRLRMDTRRRQAVERPENE